MTDLTGTIRVIGGVIFERRITSHIPGSELSNAVTGESERRRCRSLLEGERVTSASRGIRRGGRARLSSMQTERAVLSWRPYPPPTAAAAQSIHQLQQNRGNRVYSGRMEMVE